MHRRERFCIHQNGDVKLPKSDDHAQAKQELDVSAPELQRVRRAIVVVDVVESVRLMQEHEDDVIDRWRRFVAEVRDEVLPKYGGHMVKSLGDGMLLEFEAVPQAVAAATASHDLIRAYNAGRTPSAEVWLRAGVHVGDVVHDDIDTFGPAVNLAARLAGLARPGDIVVSAEARNELVPGLDSDVEDMGDCWVKHLDTPVRAARIPPSAQRVRQVGLPSKAAEESIGVAVLPFQPRQAANREITLGDLLADDVIAQLSRLPQLRVISRLSTSAFSRRALPLGAITTALDCQYVVHGNYAVNGGAVRLNLSMVNRDSEAVVWAQTFSTDEKGVLAGDESLVDDIVSQVCAALVGVEVRRACTMPLPSLVSYTILLGAVSLLHSLSKRDFERSREMLVYLIERHPTLATPRAWLGLWHVMRVGQGWSSDAAQDASIARSFIAAALDLEPNHSLALAVDGLVCAYVQKDLVLAGQRYEAALKANPNEGLAWLYRSAWYAYQEEGELAVQAALKAQRLSPLDPMKYYYDNFTSTAMLSRGDLSGAIDYGRRSLRANRMHGPTLRILAIAHSLAGDMAEAKTMVDSMLEQERGFTVSAFRARYPGQRARQVNRYADALREAGLPA